MNTKDEIKNESAVGSNIVTGNILKVFLYILLPILFIKMLNYLYEIYDTLMISVSGIGSVKDVVVLNQIKKTISTFGSGIIMGAAVLIAQLVGAKKYEKAKTVLNTTFYFLVGISVFIIAVIIPFSPSLLLLIQTPKDIISSASGYFIVQMLCIVIEMFNALFSGIQKIKGKVSIIFYLNLGVIAIKILLNTLFVYGGFENVNVTWLASATLIAQSFMLVFALKSLFSNKTELSVSKPNFKFPLLKPVLSIAMPIFIGNFLFNYSKVFINAQMSIFYGSGVLTAVGIAGTIFAFNQQFITVIGDSSKTIMAQNYGSKKYSRVFGVLKISLISAFSISLINFLAVTFFGSNLVMLLMDSSNMEEIAMTVRVLQIQKFEILFVLIMTCLNAFINAIGKTKYTMVINIIRTVVTRIPLLFYFYHVLKFGYETAPIILVISNAIGAVLTIFVGVYLIVKLKKESLTHEKKQHQSFETQDSLIIENEAAPDSI